MAAIRSRKISFNNKNALAALTANIVQKMREWRQSSGIKSQVNQVTPDNVLPPKRSTFCAFSVVKIREEIKQ